MATSETVGGLGFGAFPCTSAYGISLPPQSAYGGNLGPTSISTLTTRIMTSQINCYTPEYVPAAGAIETAPCLRGLTNILVGAGGIAQGAIPFHNQGNGPATVIAVDADGFPLGCSIPKSLCCRLYTTAGAGPDGNIPFGWVVPQPMISLTQSVGPAATNAQAAELAPIVSAFSQNLVAGPDPIVNNTLTMLSSAGDTNPVHAQNWCGIQQGGGIYPGFYFWCGAGPLVGGAPANNSIYLSTPAGTYNFMYDVTLSNLGQSGLDNGQ